ncbi:MAG: / family protein [Actinomycetospora sp.]|jgi:cell wall assembly regulator SMI1|nr:/ family protein [Actinomycetospora sp.]
MVDRDPAPGGTVGQVIVAGPDEDERRVLAPGVGAHLDALLAAELDPSDPDALADGVAWWDAPGLR